MKKTNSESKYYRGRFAPSPTGELHFGSLLAAMASYADAKHQHGQWLLRIDDIDTPRVVADSDQHIIKTLEQCGFEWDGDITYQSQLLGHYQEALEHLIENANTYYCSCSRKEIQAKSINGLYPGTCRNQSKPPALEHAIRLKVPQSRVEFTDQIQQAYVQNLAQQVGDFVIFRKDNIFTYQLSVVVDDFHSDITHVIRGYDLIDSTPRQIYLQQLLNYPRPNYAHIPLAVTNDNLKLSKLSHARKVDHDLMTLIRTAKFLGQDLVDEHNFDSIHDFWQYLILNWDINKVPRMEKQQIMY